MAVVFCLQIRSKWPCPSTCQIVHRCQGRHLRGRVSRVTFLFPVCFSKGFFSYRQSVSVGNSFLFCCSSAFHGNIESLMDISPLKYKNKNEKREHVHVVSAESPEMDFQGQFLDRAMGITRTNNVTAKIRHFPMRLWRVVQTEAKWKPALVQTFALFGAGDAWQTHGTCASFCFSQVACPDTFRGKHRDHSDPATAYAEEVRKAIRNAEADGQKVFARWVVAATYPPQTLYLWSTWLQLLGSFQCDCAPVLSDNKLVVLFSFKKMKTILLRNLWQESASRGCTFARQDQNYSCVPLSRSQRS